MSATRGNMSVMGRAKSLILSVFFPSKKHVTANAPAPIVTTQETDSPVLFQTLSHFLENRDLLNTATSDDMRLMAGKIKITPATIKYFDVALAALINQPHAYVISEFQFPAELTAAHLLQLSPAVRSFRYHVFNQFGAVIAAEKYRTDLLLLRQEVTKHHAGTLTPQKANMVKKWLRQIERNIKKIPDKQFAAPFAPLLKDIRQAIGVAVDKNAAATAVMMAQKEQNKKVLHEISTQGAEREFRKQLAELHYAITRFAPGTLKVETLKKQEKEFAQIKYNIGAFRVENFSDRFEDAYKRIQKALWIAAGKEKDDTIYETECVEGTRLVSTQLVQGSLAAAINTYVSIEKSMSVATFIRSSLPETWENLMQTVENYYVNKINAAAADSFWQANCFMEVLFTGKAVEARNHASADSGLITAIEKFQQERAEIFANISAIEQEELLNRIKKTLVKAWLPHYYEPKGTKPPVVTTDYVNNPVTSEQKRFFAIMEEIKQGNNNAKLFLGKICRFVKELVKSDVKAHMTLQQKQPSVKQQKTLLTAAKEEITKNVWEERGFYFWCWPEIKKYQTRECTFKHQANTEHQQRVKHTMKLAG